MIFLCARCLQRILLRCILGKLAMGVFALPLTKNEFLTLSFAWGSWGEFSFILALRAVRGNLLDGRQAAAGSRRMRSKVLQPSDPQYQLRKELQRLGPCGSSDVDFALTLRVLREAMPNFASTLFSEVLISIIICPTALRCVLTRSAREANACIELAKPPGGKGSSEWLLFLSRVAVFCVLAAEARNGCM